MKPKNKIFVSCVAALAVVVAVFGPFVYCCSQKNPNRRSNIESLSFINSATSIEVYRVKRSGPFFAERIDGNFIVGRGLTPNREMAIQIKTLLTSHFRRKANPMGQKGCPPPEPGFALRFKQGEEFVDVLFCFHCYDLMIVQDAWWEWRDFYFPKTERNAWIRIAKALFPNDADINKIGVAG